MTPVVAMRVLRASLIAQLLLRALGATDATRQSEASGQRVVEASLHLLAQSDIFPSDFDLMRRIAWVESKDGEDPNTFRQGYFGGIWQVDRIGYEATKDVSSHPSLRDRHELIKTHFGIDWASVEWRDLTKPLYSMLAARLLLWTKPAAIPSTTQSQAYYWKQYYNSNHDNAAGTVEKFMKDVEALEAKTGDCGSHVRLLVMLVLDGSGSIGSSDYQQAKSFLATSLLPSLEVGPGRSRVAMLYYSDYAELQLNFTEDADRARSRIVSAPYPNSGTKTGEAIRVAARELKTALESSGENGWGRLMLVLTDGRSGDEVSEAAQLATEAGTTILALGIGSNVDHETLLNIAAGVPEHVLNAGSYGTINNVRKRLLESACRVPVVIKPPSPDSPSTVERTVGKNQMTYLTVPVPEEGITIDLTASSGSVTGYASYKITTPSSAFYEYRLLPGSQTALPPPQSEGGRRLAASNTSQNSSNLYVGFEGQEANNTFQVAVSAGMVTSDSQSTRRRLWGTPLLATAMATALAAALAAAAA